MNENVIIEVDAALKESLGDWVRLNGAAVPVRIVTPDEDIVELELPTLTIQLMDLRRGLARSDNERIVEKHDEAGTAEVKWPDASYDLFYAVGAYTEKTRTDRMLLDEIRHWIDAHPLLTLECGREVYIGRDLTLRDTTRERTYAKTITVLVKTRMPVDVKTVVPLVRERVVEVEQM